MNEPGAQPSGQYLRDRRTDVGIDQTELARLAAVSRTTVHNAERGQGLHAKTLARLLMALGCAPVITQTGDVPIVPILTAGLARTIARALLSEPKDLHTAVTPKEDWGPEREAAWHKGLVLPYFRLIDAVAKLDKPRVPGKEYLPEDFDALRTFLAAQLTREELLQLDRELHRWFGVDYRYADHRSSPLFRSGLGKGLGVLLPDPAKAHPYEEVRAIMNLEAPREAREMLLAHMQRRREQLTATMNETLLQELATVIELLTSGALSQPMTAADMQITYKDGRVAEVKMKEPEATDDGDG